jgi:hypothetical protein
VRHENFDLNEFSKSLEQYLWKKQKIQRDWMFLASNPIFNCPLPPTSNLTIKCFVFTLSWNLSWTGFIFNDFFDVNLPYCLTLFQDVRTE